MFQQRLHFDNLSLELLTNVNMPLVEYNFLANMLLWILIVKKPHRKYWEEHDSQTNVIWLFSLSSFKKYVDTYPIKVPTPSPFK
jgi:hypothetical protein